MATRSVTSLVDVLSDTRQVKEYHRWVFHGEEPKTRYLQLILLGSHSDAVYRCGVDDPSILWPAVTVGDMFDFVKRFIPERCRGNSENMKTWRDIGGIMGMDDSEKLVAMLSDDFSFWLEIDQKFARIQNKSSNGKINVGE